MMWNSSTCSGKSRPEARWNRQSKRPFTCGTVNAPRATVCHALHLEQVVLHRLQCVSIAGVQALWRRAGKGAVCRHQHCELHIAVFERRQDAYSQMTKVIT